MIIGAASAACYRPMRQRIAARHPQADAVLTAALGGAEAEIDRWQAAPGDIADAPMMVEPE